MEDNQNNQTNNPEPTPQPIQPTAPNVVTPNQSPTTAAPAATSSNVYPQPVNTTQQYPMSASQLGYNQKESKFSPKSLLKPILLALVAILVIGGGFFAYKNLTGFGEKTVQAGDVSYTVKFNRTARQVSIGDKYYLEGKDPVTGTAMTLSVGKATKSNFDCHESSGSTIKIIAKPEIEGEEHNLCFSESLNTYAMNFKHNGEWYFFTIFPKDKNLKGKIDQETVKTVASSVRIN